MSRILYESPDEQQIVDPDEAALRHALFEQPWDDWWHSPGGGAALCVILDEGEKGACRVETHWRTRKTHRVSTEHPALVIAQPEPDEFLINWFEKGDQLQPYNGGSCDDFAVYTCGGNQHRIPRACLVEPIVALTILMAYVTDQSKSPAVNWVSPGEVPVPSEFWDPM